MNRAGATTATAHGGSLADRFAKLISLNRTILGALLVVSAISFAAETTYLTPRSETLGLAVRAVRLSHVAMLNQETAVRGYILTHALRFLDPYEVGRRELARQSEFLIGSLAAYPDLARNFLEVRLAAQTWTLEAAEPSIARHAADLDRHKELFDTYRSHQGRLEQNLEARMNLLVRERAHLLALAGVVQLLLFGLAMMVSRRRLTRLQTDIGGPVIAVVDAIQSVRKGALNPVKRQPAPTELTEIQVGLDEMIGALVSERASREARTLEVAERATVLRQILDSAREFSGSLNLRYVLRTLGRASGRVAGAPRAVIWLIDDVGNHLRAGFDGDAADGIPVGLDALEIGAGLVGRAARYARTVTPDVPNFSSPSAAVEVADEMAVPLIVGARVVGVLQLLGGGVQRLVADRREILEILASHGAAAIESSRLHQAVEERSYRDALTKLYNRRRLEEDLETELKRARRYKSALSFVMMDVDHFKRFNDTYGHAKGDAILEELGHVLETTIRNTDTAYRYGGEEFSVLLRETPASGAVEFAERLRRRIELHFKSANPASPVTSSIGVATFSSDMRGPSALVEAADAALYEAKRSGRNRVMSAGEAPQIPDGGADLERPPTRFGH
jgi:diguanylate cyclase (GGDEF)-like protein